MTAGARIVADFVSSLASTTGLAVRRTSVSQNVWEVIGSAQCLLYVKGRGALPLRWGVTANVVERLKREKQKWFIVLLYETKDKGYLLSSTDVLHYIEYVWPLGRDGDYKPAPGTYLFQNAPFVSFDQCVRDFRG